MRRRRKNPVVVSIGNATEVNKSNESGLTTAILGIAEHFKIELTFHAGCLNCRRRHSKKYSLCPHCQYFSANWDFPDLSDLPGPPE